MVGEMRMKACDGLLLAMITPARVGLVGIHASRSVPLSEKISKREAEPVPGNTLVCLCAKARRGSDNLYLAALMLVGAAIL